MKEIILDILNQNKGSYISGQTIAKTLNISRTTVSINIKKLIDQGYNITSSTKKGYCLSQDTDLININKIKQNLNPFYQNIYYFDTIDSTNTKLKENKYIEGDIIIANHQSKGKGRNGKSFYSPKDKGIYLSFLLKPPYTIHQSLKITACLAVAIYKAIKDLYQIETQIKWVNDILYKNKKIAGILCEANLEMNTGKIESMIVGIGINIHPFTIPEDLKDIATYLENKHPIKRSDLITSVLNNFYQDYQDLDQSNFLTTYRKASCVLNKTILVNQNNQTYLGYVKKINDDASLTIIVDNQERVLNSGEITIRPLT